MLTPAISIVLLLTGTSVSLSAVSPNLILGKWRGTDNPTNCPQTELAVTPNVFTSVQDGVAHQSRILGIGPQGKSGNEINVTTGQENIFLVTDANHIALEGVFHLCPYVREH